MFDGQIDYTTYSDRDLREAEQSIDRIMFPMNAARLDDEIRARGNRPTPPVEYPAIAPAAPPVPLGAKRAFWLLAAYMLVQLGVGAVGGIGAAIFATAYFGTENENRIQAFIAEVALLPITLAAVLAGGAVVFAIVRSSFPGKLREGAFAAVGWTATPILHAVTAAFIGAAVAWFYMHSATSIAPPAPTQEFGPMATAAATATAGQEIQWVAFVWLAIVLVAPPIEEFLFRGVMLAGFTRSFGALVAGVLVTVLFVATHLFETHFYLPAILFITALAVGTLIARLVTRSLVAPICMHGAYNLSIAVGSFL